MRIANSTWSWRRAMSCRCLTGTFRTFSRRVQSGSDFDPLLTLGYRSPMILIFSPADHKEHSMQRRYATADVFTTRPMSGNPVAVVLDADGLTTAQMQALATEFNYRPGRIGSPGHGRRGGLLQGDQLPCL